VKFTSRTTADRKLNLNMDAINAYLSRWKPGTEVEVEIKRAQSKVSDPMRRYYWGVVLPTFMTHLGYEPEEDEVFHRQLKIVYFRVKPDQRGIYRERDIPSVFSNGSEIDMELRSEFLSWVIRKAAENGCYIPDSEERRAA